MTLDDVADRLYGLPPEEFTAARTAAAKADKPNGKAISALRKPTVGAWLINTLARAEPELLDQLLALGPALAEAQGSGQGDALRQLGEQRRQLVSAVTQRAFAVAERTPTAATTAEVEGTLEAALADPAAAEAVRSGRLTSALSYAGFGTVDLAGAVAAPVAAKPTERRADVADAEARAHEAAGLLDDAVRAAEAAAGEAEQRAADVEAATQAQAQAEQALRDARERRASAEEAARAARHRAEVARHDVDQAQAKAEKARALLDRLRRKG